MCPPQHYPALDNTRTRGGRQCFLVLRKCREGTCDECGIDKLIGKHCPKEWDSDKPCTYHCFATVCRGTNQKGCNIEAKEFVPIPSTRASFMEAHFGKDGMLRKEQAHRFGIQFQYRSAHLHAVNRDRIGHPFTHATKIKDFASKFEHPRRFVTTCAFAESSNNCVTIIGHSTHTVMVKVITFHVLCAVCYARTLLTCLPLRPPPLLHIIILLCDDDDDDAM